MRAARVAATRSPPPSLSLSLSLCVCVSHASRDYLRFSRSAGLDADRVSLREIPRGRLPESILERRKIEGRETGGLERGAALSAARRNRHIFHVLMRGRSVSSSTRARWNERWNATAIRDCSAALTGRNSGRRASPDSTVSRF